jgi:hypothetical protein
MPGKGKASAVAAVFPAPFHQLQGVPCAEFWRPSGREWVQQLPLQDKEAAACTARGDCPQETGDVLDKSRLTQSLDRKCIG